MGGVDLLDSLLGYYRNKIKSKKWYHRIFFHLIDMVIVNAWILWRKYKNADVHLVDFKLAIANLLANAGKDISAVTKRGRPSIETNNIRKPGLKVNKPHSAIRFVSVGHWPVIRDNRSRCQHNNCSEVTYFKCDKCRVALCLTRQRNCFKDYHMS